MRTTNTYPQFQRFIATILLLSMGLQSCTSNLKLDAGPEKSPKASTKPAGGLVGGSKAQRKVPAPSLAAQESAERLALVASPANVLYSTKVYQSSANHTEVSQGTPPAAPKASGSSHDLIATITPLKEQASTRIASQPIQQQNAPLAISMQPLTASGGQEIQLCQKGDQWQAHVTECLGHFRRQVTLPVVCAPGYEVADLIRCDKYQVKYLLHVVKSDQRYLSDELIYDAFVYIGRQNLPGGMHDHEGADEEKESGPPRKVEEQKVAELPGPSQQRASRAAVQALLEEREDLTSTAALVAALATAQPHEQPALQRWLQGYIEWFTQQPLATLNEADIQDYTTLANIEVSTPEHRALLRRYLFSLANKIQPGQYGETPLLEALAYSLQTVESNLFEGDPSTLIQLGHELLARLDATRMIFSGSTYPTYRPVLYALHQVLVLTQRIAPGQWSTLQADGLYFRFKAQLEAIAGQAQYYPFVYHGLVLQQSLQRLEKEESHVQENLLRAYKGIQGTFYLYQGVRALASLDLDFDSFQAAYENIQEAFARKRVEGLAWYDWLQALNHASLLSLVHEEAYSVFEQWLGAMKPAVISEETGCKALRYGIVSQLGTLALESTSPMVRAASIAQLDELTKTDAWVDEPALVEALLERLAAVAAQNQADQARALEALQARSILKALVRNGSIIAPSKSRFAFGSRKRNTDPSAAQSTIQAWLGNQDLDDKLSAVAPQPAAPAQVFAQVGQQLGLIFPIARATSQQWLKEFYEQSFGQVSRLLCQGPFLAIQALDCALLLQEEKFQPDLKQQARAEAAGLPKPLVQVKTPIHWTTLFQPRSTREGEPTKEVQQVFVVGDPSIGKTTLSRKLAYAWAQGQWESELQAVYVLPFRELAQQHAKVPSLGKAAMRLEAAIADLCFPGVHDPATRSSLQLTLRHSLKRPDTLVILDAPEDCPEASKPLLAQAQAGRHKLLVLSRPAAKQAQPVLDLTIAHAGLNEAQVAAYVHDYFKSPEKAQGLLKLINDHEALQTLVHVPVHLITLCALWQDYAEDLDEETLSTLPSLYRQLTGYMWERYAQQHNAQCTVVQWLQNKHRDRLFKILGLLALYGLKKGEVRMSHRAVKDILDNVPRNKEMEQLLAESGFLQVQEKSYQFLHPSFQTYFAGRLLARQLCARDHEAQEEGVEFLARHQYQRQCSAVLPFMAWEASKGKGRRGVRQLLQALNANPQAVAGLAHLNLQLQCINEWLCQQGEAVEQDDLESLEAEFGFMAALKEQLHQGLAQARENGDDRVLLEELLSSLRPLKALVAHAPEVVALLQPALQDQDDWLRAAAHQALGALPLQQLMELYWASNDPALMEVIALQLCSRPPVIAEGSQPGQQCITLHLPSGPAISWEQPQAAIACFNECLKGALLRAAVEKDDTAAMQELLASGANANARANDGTTALMSAVAQGHSAAMELLLKHGADVNATDSAGMNALMVAAYSGQVDALRRLLTKEAAVNASMASGWTALMGAGTQADPEALALLLEQGADVNAKRTDGWTALMATAKHGHPAGLQLLVANQADLGATDRTGKTALAWAAVQGHTEAVALLVASGADANAALLWVAEHGDVQAAQRLIASGANAQATLMQAAEQGNAVAAQTLLRSGADAYAALSQAAAQGQPELVAFLRESEENVQAARRQEAVKHSMKALMQTAQGHPAAFQALLEHGSAPNITGEEGMLALSVAAERGHPAVVSMLIEHGADKNGALIQVAKQGHRAALALLLTQGANVDASTEDGRTALIEAAAQGHSQAAQLLIKHGANADAALQWAAVQGHTQAIQTLMASGADADAALRWAAENGYTTALALLLANGAAINAVDEQGQTALIKAAATGQRAAVELLLAQGANIRIKDHQETTALMWAESKGHTEVERRLIEKGRGIDDALLAVANAGSTTAAVLLLDQGADIHKKGNNGMTALKFAALAGHTATVELLLDREANIHARDNEGKTALMYAAWGGHTATVALLLDRRADINATDSDDRTALMWACNWSHAATAALLLDRGANINATDNRGWTALMWAVTRSCEAATGTATLLLNRGASIHAKNNEGYTALTLAYSSSSVALLQARGAR